MMAVAEGASVSVPQRGGAVGGIVRDIARGGLVGLVVGLVVGGLGGRLVMRVAALAVPSADGGFTENGNQIGDITLAGTFALLVFGGLLTGIMAAIVWVVVSPWIPGAGVRRALLSMPIAIGLAGFFLIQGDNTDFIVLRHDAAVVALLLGLVALCGFAMAVGDDLLDRRLPHVGPRPGAAGIAYAVLAVVGSLFLPPVLAVYLADAGPILLGIALLATGTVTLVWWGLRMRGHQEPPRRVLIAGRASLLTAVVIGMLVLVPELAEALGAA